MVKIYNKNIFINKIIKNNIITIIRRNIIILIKDIKK